MRLWTLHPRYLDRAGLLAAWREALLAQRVLEGGTRGYRHHRQLARFRSHPDPLRAIGRYLAGLAAEAAARGYRFDASKIRSSGACEPIATTDGQLEFERRHLVAKLRQRDPGRGERLAKAITLEAHPLFVVRPGPVEEWESTQG